MCSEPFPKAQKRLPPACAPARLRQGQAVQSRLLQLLLHRGSGSLPGRPWGAANGCHGAPGYAGNESLGSLSERHCLDGIGVRTVSPLYARVQGHWHPSSGREKRSPLECTS